MSDLFHEAVPAEFVTAVWRAMQATPQHTYQILTKRPDRMAEIAASLPVLPNVWLGTSVESYDYFGRIDDLRKVAAAVCRGSWSHGNAWRLLMSVNTTLAQDVAGSNSESERTRF
jgi:protein gp37